MTTDLTVRATAIDGLLVLDLPLHGDSRGWFKESWQRERMLAIGLPDFGPVQQNVSFNAHAGATRGIHAEPWDKLVSLATGRAFGAWVDLRPGPGFGTSITLDLDPTLAIYVPRGVGNSYQALEDGTSYAYLVNEHWRPDVVYTAVALDDPALDIDWPIPIIDAEVSEKDRANPLLDDVTPMEPRRALILGGYGQLGRALRAALPDADAVDLDTFDTTDPAAYTAVDWARYDTVVNAAAYTAVDAAESGDGRRAAWAANVTALTHLARVARRHRLTVVHISSDYVFDGTQESHDEEEPFSPLGVYGQTKAAGDAVVATVDRHYVVRTSWVIGDGGNFVRTMARLAKDGVSPSVVDDQVGRLTFTDDLARGIVHLLRTRPTYGTYNLSGSGAPMSWYDVAREVFARCGRDPGDVTPTSTGAYGADKDLAPRPKHSVLDLAKIEGAGFVPMPVTASLDSYVV
ncbi:bifunctional dTDP-4-dehydrorhamnose 3,5-epimerase family protein/NAD(P)-dependent oxidoreductase [Mumia sp. zg.B21]|uniref:sugar nucleotide-binding protein n=1 Tax=Mumia sp. zg.B21 TaxID=2855447 RepID=UPI001C6F0C06|nr:bifunctional dTDP-4-dehydrorhamnose 3,5-epimerase family protein/NAD(P)-dependent oxidoreductase [Mumia sp. zg.B21]MBW9209502.1 bifunctional dTDP-4-dehydrorhamnose 3,5-epimerase family protein/NAD(P)-dependent oxidoreductase [Mumia sp. zg.B21]